MTVSRTQATSYDVAIVGAGSAGIATASSFPKRNGSLRIALIDPSSDHYYQSGWTMVSGGIFEPESTHRKTADHIPAGIDWIPHPRNISDTPIFLGRVMLWIPRMQKPWPGLGDKRLWLPKIFAMQ